MTNLLARNQLTPDPTWYFEDARYSTESRVWVYKWPSKSYPHMVSIHKRDLNATNKIKVRQWIENNVNSTVILDEKDKSYRIYFSTDRTYNNSFERDNRWYCFYFAHEQDAVFFKLSFLDIVKEITDLHPYEGDSYEKTSYYKSY